MKKVLGFLLLFCLLLPQSLLAEPLLLDDGTYEVDVALWHAYEDKLSMGSDGIDKKAELVKEGDKVTLYLSMKPITALSLTTSVERFFILDKAQKNYIRGLPTVFDLVISPEEKARPSVILLPLKEKEAFYSVLVDPGISLMGEDPIKARLYVDWEKIQPLQEEGAIIKKVKEAPNEEPNPVTDYQMDKVKLFTSQEGEFKVSSLSKQDLEERGLKIDILDKVKGFEVSLVAPLLVIPEDKTVNVKSLAEPVAFEEKTRLLFLEKGYDKVFWLKEGKFEALDFKTSPEGVEVMVDSLGVFALVKKGEKPALTSISTNTTKLSLPLTKPVVKKASVPKPAKVKKVDRKAVQEKALALKGESKVKTEEGILPQTEPKPKERYGIIFLVLSFYAFLALVGLYLCKRVYPSLMSELERRHFIRLEQLKGGAK